MQPTDRWPRPWPWPRACWPRRMICGLVNIPVVIKTFLIKILFLRRGWTEQFLNCSGKTPEDKERLMILVTVETRTEVHCLTREAGIGSR
jgi:hypothetical protein